MVLQTLFSNRRHMSRLAWGIGVIILVAFAILLAISSSGSSSLPMTRASENPTPSTNRRYFEETGFVVAGKFLDYFENQGGLEIFGYPISAEYNKEGVLIQYFQKARMEWHVVGPYADSIVLGKLGEELGMQSPPLDTPVKSTRRRLYFDETRHTVAYFFLKYFENYGGVDLFGPPITEMYIEDQKIVQYFQRIKLVWDPGSMRVTTGDLGDRYVKTYRDTFPPNVLTPFDLQYGENPYPELTAILAVDKATLGSDHAQKAAVVVYNQEPDAVTVPDINVKITLTTKSGEPISEGSFFGSTDAEGRMEILIPLKQFVVGDVIVVKAEAGYGLVQAYDESSFIVW